jgi:hypothetical protein
VFGGEKAVDGSNARLEPVAIRAAVGLPPRSSSPMRIRTRSAALFVRGAVLPAIALHSESANSRSAVGASGRRTYALHLPMAGSAGHPRACLGEPQSADIALRRSAKQATVLAAELRGAFIANLSCSAARVVVLVQHQLSRFL